MSVTVTSLTRGLWFRSSVKGTLISPRRTMVFSNTLLLHEALEAWEPGNQGGNAVADVLFGDANPGGKLTVTWPRNGGQEPLYYTHNLTFEPETDPNTKSKYQDQPISPLYPFGYGLSYTKFAVSNLQLSKAKAKVGESVGVSVDVQNMGTIAGDEVVQIYIHQQSGSASRPVRQLKGFERVSLGPGESKTVHFTLGKDELTYWSPSEWKWIIEPAVFDVWVGEDSTASPHGSFENSIMRPYMSHQYRTLNLDSRAEIPCRKE